MSEVDPEAIDRANSYCTCCHRGGLRVQLNGAWVCPKCDYGWAILALQRPEK